MLPITQALTMTSREIAELTGKEHFIVLRDIKNMITQLYDLQDNTNLYDLKIQGVIIEQDSHTKRVSLIRLDKNHTLTLLTGYDVKARFKVINRWQELEEQVAAQAAKVNGATTWEEQRQAGKEVRANFTGTLKNHGVKGYGFANCTNAIYQPLFGAKASQLKQQRGLTTQDSLRDAMSNEELVVSSFAEIVAGQRVEVNNDQGNSPCYKTCKASGEAVKGLLVKKLK
jgi:phage regulator Rha-like protein